MLRIVVRAKKDADAVKAALSAFYEGWGVEVSTLKGVRGVEEALGALKRVLSDDEYVILLVGREDAKLCELERYTPVNVLVHQLRYKKVRNARLSVLAYEISRARARLRCSVGWNGSAYVFSHKLKPIYAEIEPYLDAFLALGEGFRARLEELVGPIGGCALLYRLLGGHHLVYSGPDLVGELEVPDEGLPRGRRVSDVVLEVREDRVVKANEEVLRVHERLAVEFLKAHGREVDEVFVPLSGGKDSTVALILAKEALGAKRITAIYVDTGVDFPESGETARRIAAWLGVKLEEVYAPVKEVLAKKGLPNHDNRWCTGLKVEALKRRVRELASGKYALVVGDRDVESRARSTRSPKRVEDGGLVLAPIKMWSTGLVQLYLKAKGAPLNPLYGEGFYRLGCYICPALRSWEVYVMTRCRRLRERLLKNKYFKEFLESKGVNAC